ncbi:hypothetical protein M8494_03935 [Serratia ureilytica]
MNIMTQPTQRELTTVMSNSFGFGGTNATLVMRKLAEIIRLSSPRYQARVFAGFLLAKARRPGARVFPNHNPLTHHYLAITRVGHTTAG